VLHDNIDAHNTFECKTLIAQAEKLKGNKGSDKKEKSNKKSWKNKERTKPTTQRKSWPLWSRR